MTRIILTGATLALLLSAVPARAEVDPEPPRTSSEARSGDYVVKATKNGDVTASNKQGQLLWRYSSRVAADKAGQLLISGEKVVVAHADKLAVLDLRTGKAFWYRTGNSKAAKMNVDGDRVTLRYGSTREVIDLQTGKTIESVRLKQ
jgi:outer membrane protein assembly factor BamB